MARFNPAKTNFVAGELSPRLDARDGLEQYAEGMKQALNGVVLPHGGFMRRPGTRFVAEVKTSADTTVLVPFIFSTTAAYICEFGDQYVRFYVNEGRLESGGSPVEVSSPYTKDELEDLQWAQSADVLWLVHPSHPPYKLQRTSATSFTLMKVSFTGGGAPMQPANLRGRNLVRYDEGTTTLEVNSHVQSPAITFDSDDVGRTYRLADTHGNRTFAKVSSVTSATKASATLAAGSEPFSVGITNITQANPGVVTTASNHGLSEKDGLFIDGVSGMTEVNGNFYRVHGVPASDKIELGTDDASIDPVDTSGFTVYSSGGTVHEAPSDWSIGHFSDTEGALAVTFHDQRLAYGGFTVEVDRVVLSRSDAFDDFDLGSAAASDAVSRRVVSSVRGAVNAVQWLVSTAEQLFIGTRGGEFTLQGANDDTITPGGAAMKPATSRGSVHTLPTVVGEIVVFLQRNARKLRQLGQVVSAETGALQSRARDISILAEHILREGGGGKQLTYQQDPDSIIWTVRSDGVLVGFTFESEQKVIGAHRHIVGGSFQGDDAVVESAQVIPSPDQDQDHVWLVVKRTIGGSTKRYVEYVEDMFQADLAPDATAVERAVALEPAFFVDSGLSLDSPVNITNITQADPGVVTASGHGFSDGDRVRIRDVVGMTEVNDTSFKVANKTTNTFELQDLDGNNVDTSGFGAYVTGGTVRKEVTSVSGLSHLDGETVQILADGAVLPAATVSAGSVSLLSGGGTVWASIVHVGLGSAYRGETMNFFGGGRLGTDQGQQSRIARIIARLHETASISFGVGENPASKEPVHFRDAGDPMDRPPPLFSGDKELPVPGGWTRTPTIFFETTDPLPATVLALYPQMESHEK